VGWSPLTGIPLSISLRLSSKNPFIQAFTRNPYYDARIEVDRHALERLKQVHLCPGMPVQAMVVTGERTLLEYLVQPLHDSITRAFRED
jgi:HlyD family secretion protein